MDYTFEKNYDTADPMWYPLLKELAKKNRRNPTDAEYVMWNLLQKSFKECKFRRQHIIGDYIVDFVSFYCKIVIEVDGGYHTEEHQMVLDEQRTEFIESKGLKVIRFTNEEVMYDTDVVKEKLYRIIYK